MESAAVISRAQRWLAVFLLIAVVGMAVFLIRLRDHASEQLHVVAGATPVPQADESAPQTVTLVIPNDRDGSLNEINRSLSLPADASGRARVLLESLLTSFHVPRSTHYVPTPNAADGSGMGPDASPEGGGDVDGVFLMPVPGNKSGTLAVVDLSAAFAAAQPSGIEPETLTLLAILRTLQANMPGITEVRFLVDGQPVQTLAGHADLTQTYLATGVVASTPPAAAAPTSTGATIP